MSQQNGQSVQSDILAAAVAALGSTASRARFRPYSKAQLPAENVLPVEEDESFLDSDSIECAFRFDVRYQVQAIDAADLAADARFVRGTRALFADPVLRGLIKTIRIIRRRWEQEEGEVLIMALVATYEVEFSTTRNDPSLPGY